MLRITPYHTAYFFFQLGRCRFVSEFEKLNRIGEGTYGIVCKYLYYGMALSR